ncbi:acetolactate synthase [Salipiger sp. HF18]|uniref:DUF6497 family protein n=1 Tax=Salipiger sp. HF18 TaxID=2721557 RepID=UPI00142E252A|nr:DUF6497 family protein [Salipiger sp. HF18]NIY98355.1 acetolactate synthase [Salipiger sp. HF18]
MMLNLPVILLVAAAAMPAAGEPVVVPSGMPVSFEDVIWDQPGDGLVYRFRFLAPEIGGEAPRLYEEVSSDMDYLCESFALPRLAAIGPEPSRIVISLMAEPVAFGDPAPEVRQYFEAYSHAEGNCIWEAF